MDLGAPPWFNQSRGRPVAGVDPWRGMYPHPPPHHYRNISYGYQQPQLRDGHQPWPDPWMDYYSQQPTAKPRQEDWYRPASRAELDNRGHAYRPLSRQGYDERYGFYETASRQNYAYRDYYHEHPAAVPGEQDWRRGAQGTQTPTEQWVLTSHSVYPRDQLTDSGRFQPQSHAQSWNQGYEDSGLWGPSQERNAEVVGQILEDRSESLGSAEPNLLSQYRDSGMSSSSYELSQYMHDSTDMIESYPWSPMQAEEASVCTPQPTAPLKFSLPHVTVCFGARGQLVRVCPNFPDEGQPALVEIHSMEVLLHDTLEQEELRSFPGPMQRDDLHKVDVMNFCQCSVSQCLHSQGPRSRDDALLWQMLLQMCRQNGCINGSDVAELLLQDWKRERYQKEQPDANLINLSEEFMLMPDCGRVDLLTGETPCASETSAQAVEKFTKLLFYGRKKEALDWAMKSELWGHALFLSSKMDPRTYSWVMRRFTSTLAQNDPLQTLFQLMAGRIPQAATCCGDTKWGNWRPHLAVILSNQMGDPEMNRRAIVTMGDNLVLKGLPEAGHCCYLTAGAPFGQYYEKSDRLVLLGSIHSQAFRRFASSRSIQRTEILEYCQSLGKPKHCIPSFQVYKLLYATRLLDYGLTSLALHYCECIASAVLTHYGSMVLITELIKLAERLKFSDPRLLERPEPEHDQEPEWLIQLRALLRQLQGNAEAGRRTPVQSDVLENGAGGTEPFTLNEEDHKPEEDSYGVSEHQSVVEGAGHAPQWMPYFPTVERVEPQGGVNIEWVIPQPAPSTELPPSYGTSEDQQVQEDTVMTRPPVPPPMSSLGNSVLFAQQPPYLSRRIRTISEVSTVSVEEEEEEEDEENRAEEEAPAREPNERKKDSGFGWFGWFRSKPPKDTATSQGESFKPTDPTLQETPPLPNPTAVADTSSHPPPPLSYLPSHNRTNPFSRSAGIKEIENPPNNNSTAILPEVEGHLGNLMTPPNYSLSVPGDQATPPAGAIPLYHPSQFPSDVGQITNKPSRPFRGRYPAQPR
ncbi:hypothetical protein FKM82_002190 [Ascaphus truei]